MTDYRPQQEISRCPVTGYRRRAISFKQVHSGDAKVFEIFYRVEYLTENGETINTAPFLPYDLCFYVTEENKVDANGTVVSEGGIMGEYEFYVLAIKSGGDFFALQQAAIPILDANQRFN